MISRIKTSSRYAVCFFSLAVTASGAILSDFTLFTFGDVDIRSEVEGNSFISGDLNGSGTFATRPFAISNAPDALVVGGDINGSNFNINGGGSVRFGGNFNGNNLNLNGGGIATNDTQAGVAGIINPIGAEILATSNFFSNLSDSNSSSSRGNNTLTLSGTGNTFSVINLNASDFSGIANVDFNLGTGSGALVVNVTGTNINFNSANFIGGATDASIRSRVLFNFFEAETLNVERTIEGSILAPLADLTITASVNGSVAVDNAIVNGEIRGSLFGTGPDGNPQELGLPAIVPEVSSFSLLIGLFATMGTFVSRRRR